MEILKIQSNDEGRLHFQYYANQTIRRGCLGL